MSCVIKNKNYLFVDFRMDGTAEWIHQADADHIARRFITKEEAIAVRDELRSLGLNPKIVNGEKGANKQTVIPFKRDVTAA